MINRREFSSALSATALSSLCENKIVGSSGFIGTLYRNARGQRLPYQLFIPPAYDHEQSYPLMLWLHGSGGRGSDNRKQIAGGNTIGSHVWTLPENQKRNPCFVYAPQCPDNLVWATATGAQPSPSLLLALEALTELRKAFSVNAQRLYVAGQSMGGFGTWTTLTYKPGLFAAAIPICGGGDETLAERLRATPIWAFHGEKDEAVPVERSRRMIAAIRQAGGKPRYTEYPAAGHVIWKQVFHEPELMSWLFSRKTTP